MLILGLNSYHGDAAAALVKNGQLVAAVEEERFCRIKHWAGLPIQSVRACLKQAGIDIGSVDHIAVNRNPSANTLEKALYAFTNSALAPTIASFADWAWAVPIIPTTAAITKKQC